MFRNLGPLDNALHPEPTIISVKNRIKTNINTKHRVVADRRRVNLQPGADAAISNIFLTFT
jgi:hypothetical protein